ncbi:hypothetical protein [Bordetella trematum]|uniref:hypothetical protein n=1 Tax=Bordetella trematum TaxID=123899 RepID=UPI003AF3BE46
MTDAWNIRHELFTLGLTIEGVTDIARQVASAKAEALAVDPCSTPGTLAYIRGVRAIRLQLIPEGWRISRSGNVESTVNDDLGIQLVFQNVDLACDTRAPQAISAKGAGSRKLVEFGKQGELFVRDETHTSKSLGVVPTVWMLCVSTEGKRLRAEISCPDVFEGNQFEGFSKRIFVVDEELDPSLRQNTPLDDVGVDDEVEIRIAKK